MPVRVIGVGDLTIDVLLPDIDRIPDWGQEVEISEPCRRLGGNIGNMAAGAAALHSDFVSFGWIGYDPEGEYIRSRLHELKLPLEGLLYLQEGKTSQSYAGIRKDGERFFLTYPGVLKHMEKLIYEHPLPPGKVVFLSGWCLPPRVRKNILVDKIGEWKHEGRWVAADLIWSDSTWEAYEDLLEVLKRLDALFLNEDELKAITKTNNSDRSLHILKKLLSSDDNMKHQLLIVKQGKKGACSISDEGISTASGLPVQLKNTVGAGDLFNLAYMHAKWNMGWDLQKTLEFACTFVPLFIKSDSSHPPSEMEVVKNMKKWGEEP